MSDMPLVFQATEIGFAVLAAIIIICVAEMLIFGRLRLRLPKCKW